MLMDASVSWCVRDPCMALVYTCSADSDEVITEDWDDLMGDDEGDFNTVLPEFLVVDALDRCGTLHVPSLPASADAEQRAKVREGSSYGMCL